MSYKNMILSFSIGNMEYEGSVLVGMSLMRSERNFRALWEYIFGDLIWFERSRKGFPEEAMFR